MSHHSSQHLTHHGDGTDLYAYHLDLPAPKTYFSGWWTRSLSAAKESLESLMMLLYMAKMMQNMTDVYTISCELPVNMDLSSTGRNVMWKPLQSPSLVQSMTKIVANPDPKKVEAIHKIPPPEGPQELQKFLRMTTYLSLFYPFSLHFNCTPARTTQEGHRVHM